LVSTDAVREDRHPRKRDWINDEGRRGTMPAWIWAAAAVVLFAAAVIIEVLARRKGVARVRKRPNVLVFITSLGIVLLGCVLLIVLQVAG